MSNKRCILIVDDDSSHRLLLRKLLSKSLPFNLTFIEASNGREAILFTHQYRPHLILMDLRMPGVDGYEAIQQIRVWNARQAMSQPNSAISQARIPIVVISADVYLSAQNRAFEVGCDEFIGKPYRLQKVRAIVNRYLMQVDCSTHSSSAYSSSSHCQATA